MECLAIGIPFSLCVSQDLVHNDTSPECSQFGLSSGSQIVQARELLQKLILLQLSVIN